MICLFTFDSIHFVLKAEKILLENNIEPEVIPTPRDISSNCGMCLRVKEDFQIKVSDILIKEKIAYSFFMRD